MISGSSGGTFGSRCIYPLRLKKNSIWWWHYNFTKSLPKKRNTVMMTARCVFVNAACWEKRKGRDESLSSELLWNGYTTEYCNVTHTRTHTLTPCTLNTATAEPHCALTECCLTGPLSPLLCKDTPLYSLYFLNVCVRMCMFVCVHRSHLPSHRLWQEGHR